MNNLYILLIMKVTGPTRITELEILIKLNYHMSAFFSEFLFFNYLSYSYLYRRSISILMSIKVVKTRKSQLFIFRGLADGNTSLGGFILHSF